MTSFMRSALTGRGLPLTVALAVLAVLGVTALLVALSGDGRAPAYGPASALAAAAPDPGERWQRSFVGDVDGTDALIGLAIEPSGRLVAYVCNGDPDDLLSNEHFGVWYSGGLDGDDARLTAAPSLDAVRTLAAVGTVKFITAQQTATGFTGTVAIADGTSNTFTAEAAAAPDGLYREVVVAGANGIDIGWVKRDGATTGHARVLGGFSDVSGRTLS
jgi:hypothetical protein